MSTITISPAIGFLNKLFYRKTVFGPSNIHSLQKYMLSTEWKNKILSTSTEQNEKKGPPSPSLYPAIIKNENKNIVVVTLENTVLENHPEKREEDTQENKEERVRSQENVYFPQIASHLFWSLYIKKYGYKEYVYIKNKTNVEMEERQKILDYFRSNKNTLKETNHKITNIMIQEILSELMTSPKLTFQTLIAFSVFYKMKIYIVKKNLYLLYNPFHHVSIDEVDTVLLHCNEKEQYGIDMDFDSYPEKINQIKNHKLYIENVEKPLKSLSSYKVSDLYDISNKLGMTFSTDVKLSKQELYQKVVETCLSQGWKQTK